MKTIGRCATCGFLHSDGACTYARESLYDKIMRESRRMESLGFERVDDDHDAFGALERAGLIRYAATGQSHVDEDMVIALPWTPSWAMQIVNMEQYPRAQRWLALRTLAEVDPVTLRMAITHGLGEFVSACSTKKKAA